MMAAIAPTLEARGRCPMLRALLGLVFLVACTSAPASSPRSPAAAPAQACVPAIPAEVASPDFPAQLAETFHFRLGAPQRITPTEDGRLALFLRASGGEAGKRALWEIDLATGKSRELVGPDALLGGAEEKLSAAERARRERARVRGGGFTSFEASADGAVVLLQLSGRLYAFTRATGKVRELPTGEGVIDPHLSPDAKRVAYVIDNDVMVVALAGGKEIAVTRGGTELRSHGLAEFMAQEELYRYRGFWWSPDGRQLLVQETDSSRLPEWTYADPAHPENPPRVTRYPRVGAPHAVVGLALVSVDAGRAPRKVKWDAARYPYLASVTWTRNAPPTIVVGDRRLKNVAVLAIDPRSGATSTLVTEKDPAWVNLDSSVPSWLPDGSGFLWSTERNGSYELELRDRKGARVATVAPPGSGYRSLLAVDGERRLAYLSASTEPARVEVWVASLDGKTPPRPVSRVRDGIVHAGFGGGSRVYSYLESSIRSGPRYGVRDVDGKELAIIPSDAGKPPFLPRLELAQVGREDVRVAIVRPRRFDPRRRYPVIDSAYGAPINNRVRADAYHYFEEQWLADVVDAIVVMIDSRGTSWRDRAWQRAFYMHYGDLPVEGHAEAIAALAAKYPEMDASRVGIYGWSNGGYVATMAILRRPDVFKVAFAGSPVADLRDYDAIMEWFFGPVGHPSWDQASLLTWAARPPTRERPARPLLLVHGTADDNVYVAHALKLAAAMGVAGRPVEFVPLVSATHMVSGPDAAAVMSRRVAPHFRRHLHGPPCE
jgi:dipeptidyl-peptidase-4